MEAERDAVHRNQSGDDIELLKLENEKVAYYESPAQSIGIFTFH
jgi:hypothetical protein